MALVTFLSLRIESSLTPMFCVQARDRCLKTPFRPSSTLLRGPGEVIIKDPERIPVIGFATKEAGRTLAEVVQFELESGSGIVLIQRVAFKDPAVV